MFHVSAIDTLYPCRSFEVYKFLYNSCVRWFPTILESRRVKAVRCFVYVSLVLLYKPSAFVIGTAYFDSCQSLPIGLQSLLCRSNTHLFCDENLRLYVDMRSASVATCSGKNGLMNGPSVLISTQIFSLCFTGC